LRADPDQPSAWERWHPLCCYGFSLPPNQMVAAKLLAIYWLPGRLRSGFSPPFLPFVSGLDRAEVATVWPELLLVGYLTAALALLLNRAPRTSAAVCAIVIIADVVAARARYANSALFTGLLLLLIALQTRERGLWMIRTQMVLLYAGASLNKLLHPDWRSGQYIEHWTQDVMQLGWLGALASWLPDGVLYLAFGWFVITAETALAITMGVPRLFGVAAALATTFHVAMLFFTEGRISWIFAYAIGAALLALWRWPEPLHRPVLPWLSSRAPGLLVRLVLPGSRAGATDARATPPWRWPVVYFAIATFFFAARHLWKIAPGP
ncbi:MAG TPA: hypothetical protein VFO62_07060, partial [Candidatus Binatia bacterium]|nr:hypothetical protein [Candidatus Binatia bacterium]